jgi:AraC family transcriptional regulator
MCTQSTQIKQTKKTQSHLSRGISVLTDAPNMQTSSEASLLRMLEQSGDLPSDHVGLSLRNALQVTLDRQNWVADGVLHYLKLAAQAHIDARRFTHIGVSPHKGGLAPWQANLVKKIIFEKIDTDISTSSLAKACNLSCSHFTRLFKQSMGVPPHRWLQECRIEKAKELLASNDCTLAEVAVKCGFADQPHFSRVFKIITDCTPFSWRRINRPELSLSVASDSHNLSSKYG